MWQLRDGYWYLDGQKKFPAISGGQEEDAGGGGGGFEGGGVGEGPTGREAVGGLEGALAGGIAGEGGFGIGGDTAAAGIERAGGAPNVRGEGGGGFMAGQQATGGGIFSTGLPQPYQAGPDTGAGAGAGGTQPAVDPYTQLINMILRQQLMEALGKYFYPTAALPGYGSAFTPGQTVPPGAGYGAAPGAPGAAGYGSLPQPTGFLPGASGQAAPAPGGGFTPGSPVGPNMSTYFSPPSQSPLPVPTAYGQGPAGVNQGWLQFLGGLGIQGLPQPGTGPGAGLAGGGSLLMGA